MTSKMVPDLDGFEQVSPDSDGDEVVPYLDGLDVISDLDGIE